MSNIISHFIEIKIKSTMRYHYTAIKIAKIKVATNPNAREDIKKW